MYRLATMHSITDRQHYDANCIVLYCIV